MRILLTGAQGFLGWHTRVRLRALTDHEVLLVGRDNWAELPALAKGADAVLHLAGVNRGSPEEVEQGNVGLAAAVGAAVAASRTVRRVVFANSTWAGSNSPYGVGKAAANTLLSQFASRAGAHYVEISLPNLFGEHGRPHYNSFVATFVDDVVHGRAPEIADRKIDLLHVQKAAQCLVDGLTTSLPQLEPFGTSTSVSEVSAKLRALHERYRSGDIPPLDTQLDVDLFNTLRAASFPGHYPLALTSHTDDRGRLLEIVRSHGGEGQTFASTTRPGITRGEHFHLGKVERFVVISGTARISLRRVFTDKVVSFDVTGEAPAAVDMPTMWVHNITNTGDTELLTLFWTNTLFDPEQPDTFWEPVAAKADA